MKKDKDKEMKEFMETGAGSIKLVLTYGKIQVLHEQTDEELFQGDLPIDGWQKIISAIVDSTVNAEGLWQGMQKRQKAEENGQGMKKKTKGLLAVRDN